MVKEFGPDNKSSKIKETSGEGLKKRILEREPLIKSLCRRVLSRSGRLDMADVITNEVLYKALEYADKHTLDGNLDAWLTVVTKNQLNHFFRSTKRYKNALSDPQKTLEISEERDIHDSTPTIEESLIAQEEEELRLKALHAAIDRLPEMRKRYLQMNLQGLDATEIARRLGLNKNTVSSTIHDARRHVAKNMGQSTDFKVKKSKKFRI